MSESVSPPRLIDIFEFARSGGRIEGALACARMPRLAPMLAAAGGELRFELRGGFDARARPAAQLRFAGRVQLECDRCGAAVEHELGGGGRYYFVRSEEELARIAIDESEDEPLLGAARFDLHQLLEDEAILALPMAPRHARCEPRPTEAQAPQAGAAERQRPFAALGQALKTRRQ